MLLLHLKQVIDFIIGLHCCQQPVNDLFYYPLSRYYHSNNDKYFIIHPKNITIQIKIEHFDFFFCNKFYCLSTCKILLSICPSYHNLKAGLHYIFPFQSVFYWQKKKRLQKRKEFNSSKSKQINTISNRLKKQNVTGSSYYYNRKILLLLLLIMLLKKCV